MDASIQQFRLTAVRVQETERPRTSNNEDRSTMKSCHRLRQAPKGVLHSEFVYEVDKSLRGVERRNSLHMQYSVAA